MDGRRGSAENVVPLFDQQPQTEVTVSYEQAEQIIGAVADKSLIKASRFDRIREILGIEDRILAEVVHNQVKERITKPQVEVKAGIESVIEAIIAEFEAKRQ